MKMTVKLESAPIYLKTIVVCSVSVPLFESLDTARLYKTNLQSSYYSRPPVARTLMDRLPRVFRTRF